jgi:hypothetical protein
MGVFLLREDSESMEVLTIHTSVSRSATLAASSDETCLAERSATGCFDHNSLYILEEPLVQGKILIVNKYTMFIIV